MLLLASPQPFRRVILPGLFVAILFITLWDRVPDPSADTNLVALNGQTMGTTFSVKVRAPAASETNDLLSSAVVEELLVVVNAMSTYEPESEISRWNRSDSTDPVTISKPLAQVVKEGLSISVLSEGAFDITVQPLVDLWGFGPKRRKDEPSQSKITAALDLVGSNQVRLSPLDLTLAKSKPGVWLDLSAIAKGYAVDRVSDRLVALGYPEHFVEIGGEIRTRGLKTDTMPWRIGVESPKANGSVRLSLPLTDRAIATSGSYRNFRKYGDKTFSHTLDPRTGRPVMHKLVSVSVVSDTCMRADAWATALSVLGHQKGFNLAERLELAASFLYIDQSGELVERQTADFRSFANADKLPAVPAVTQ
jgi:thiamine biosynthesis lipoprotein